MPCTEDNIDDLYGFCCFPADHKTTIFLAMQHFPLIAGQPSMRPIDTKPDSPRAPLWQATVSQLGGGVLALGAASVFPSLWEVALVLAAVQGLFAASIAWLLRAPLWWLVIHVSFVPLAVLARETGVPPWAWLSGFVLLLLIFWRTDRSRVPLYLTNAVASSGVAGLLPVAPCRVIDLGCGDGGLLLRLSAERPDCQFVGFEHAPLPWLWAWLRSRGKKNVSVRFGDFWSHSLKNYEIVYAFLSPAPMPDLWSKAQKEMGNGALLISNSFEIPDATPEQILNVDDRRQTRLFCYRPKPAPAR
jgi:hypothetical protein